MSPEGFMHTEMGAEEAEQRVKKIPVRSSTEGRKHKACMENTRYFSLARMLLFKATSRCFSAIFPLPFNIG